MGARTAPNLIQTRYESLHQSASYQWLTPWLKFGPIRHVLQRACISFRLDVADQQLDAPALSPQGKVRSSGDALRVSRNVGNIIDEGKRASVRKGVISFLRCWVARMIRVSKRVEA